MNDKIQIIEKPEWVSWDDVHKVLWKAHEANRSNGMNMAHAAFSGKEIEDYLGPDGKMFVAVCDDEVVGVAAYKEKDAKFWYGAGQYAYCCFAAVLPEYAGQGVYRQLVELREKTALAQGIDKMMFNTHPKNSRVIGIALKNGYKMVSYASDGNASWVYLVKWLNGAPYSDCRLNSMFGVIKGLRTIQSIFKRKSK